MKILRQKAFSHETAKVLLGLGTVGAALGSTVGEQIGYRKGKRAAKEEYKKFRQEAEEDYNSGETLKEQKEKLKNAKLLKKDIKRWRKEKSSPKAVMDTLESIADDDIRGYQYNIDRMTGKYGKGVAESTKNQFIDTAAASKSSKSNTAKDRERLGVKRGAAIGTGIGLLSGAALLKATRK